MKRRFHRHLTKRKNRRYRHRRSDRGSSQRPNLRLSRSVGSCPNLRRNSPLIHHPEKRKTHTSLVQSCGRLRKSLRENLNGPRRRDPEFLNATDVVPVNDGEVRNQAVIKIILFIITFYLCSRSRGRGSLHCDRWKDRPSV